MRIGYGDLDMLYDKRGLLKDSKKEFYRCVNPINPSVGEFFHSRPLAVREKQIV